MKNLNTLSLTNCHRNLKVRQKLQSMWCVCRASKRNRTPKRVSFKETYKHRLTVDENQGQIC